MENINITIDELTSLIKNILDNKTLNIDENFILKDIMKEHQELKKKNRELKEELKQKVITSNKKDTTNREVKYQPSI